MFLILNWLLSFRDLGILGIWDFDLGFGIWYLDVGAFVFWILVFVFWIWHLGFGSLDFGLGFVIWDLEFYILGSYERYQLQIFNEFDPCCFSGNAGKTFDFIIQETITDIGTGNFEVFIDESQNQHKISKKSLEVILQRL